MRSDTLSDSAADSLWYWRRTLSVARDNVFGAATGPTKARTAAMSSPLRPRAAVTAFCSAVGVVLPDAVMVLPERTPVEVPPLVHAPLPVGPVSVKVVVLTTVIGKVPLAAVFPSTLAMRTDWPV